MRKNQPTISNQDMAFNVSANISWGRNVTFGPNCKFVSIGYGSFLGSDIYIDVEELHIGDYFTIHHGSVIHGKKCIIGHNNWIGQYCVLDSLGGLLMLGNNVGVGAHSQLWSHMKFGDRLAGCRWYRMEELSVGDDVWFVGHCIVAPIRAESRSMLMLGGVVVKDMKENHIYAGVPAKDVTEKMGYQFEDNTLEEKEEIFLSYIKEYKKSGNPTNFIKIVESFDGIDDDDKYTYFSLNTRKYLPNYSDEEFRFMRFLLYDRAKFLPIEK